MATNYISKVNLNDTIYSLKDTEARAAISALETAVASSLIFKGVITSATEITDLTDYKLGWTYKANAEVTIADVGTMEPGDMVVCINSNAAFNAADWTIVQNNVEIMVGADGENAGVKGLVPAPGATANDLVLHGDGTWRRAVIEWGTF